MEELLNSVPRCCWIGVALVLIVFLLVEVRMDILERKHRNKK